MEGFHSLATTAERQKLLKPGSPGRVPEPAAPLQYRQSALQSSCEPVRPGRVQPPGVCREVSEERHTPTLPLCLLQKARNRCVGTGRPWDTVPCPPQTSAGLRAALRGVTPSPRKGSLVVTRQASGLHESCAHLS